MSSNISIGEYYLTLENKVVGGNVGVQCVLKRGYETKEFFVSDEQFCSVLIDGVYQACFNSGKITIPNIDPGIGKRYANKVDIDYASEKINEFIFTSATNFKKMDVESFFIQLKISYATMIIICTKILSIDNYSISNISSYVKRKNSPKTPIDTVLVSNFNYLKNFLSLENNLSAASVILRQNQEENSNFHFIYILIIVCLIGVIIYQQKKEKKT